MSEEEEDGVEQDSATEQETVVAMVPSREAGTEYSPFSESLDTYRPAIVPKMVAEDGLPTQVAEGGGSTIPVLSVDTLVCMGDQSSFVLRESRFGEVLFSTKDATIDRTGLWWHCLKEDIPKKVWEKINPSSRRSARAGTLIRVYPLRPPCKHYVRQLADLDLNPDHKNLHRLCAARRTTEGTFMGVGDFGVYACSMRDPRDPDTDAKLEEFDKRKIEQGRQRMMLSIFSKEE